MPVVAAQGLRGILEGKSKVTNRRSDMTRYRVERIQDTYVEADSQQKALEIADLMDGADWTAQDRCYWEVIVEPLDYKETDDKQ